MELFLLIEEKLKELSINFNVVEHEPALTTEQADRFIEGLEGVRTKTMFLTNRKKTEFYMLIMDDKKRLDMKKLGEIVSANHIKIVSENTIYEKIMSQPGIVSPFALMNNKEKDIKVYIDKEIIEEEYMTFHPGTNEKTLFIKTVDLLKFLESIEYDVNVIEI